MSIGRDTTRVEARNFNPSDTHDFSFDVFLSHSSVDKPIVVKIAERLKREGLRVWIDSWEIRAGDNILAKIEEGLQKSRILVLCMSQSAFSSEWASIEAGTFRFRDPLNKGRRFIPLKLDACEIPGSLAQFMYIDWKLPRRSTAVKRLIEACRPSPTETEGGSQSKKSLRSKLDVGKREIKSGDVLVSTFGKQRKFAVIGGASGRLSVVDLVSEKTRTELRGHKSNIWGLALSSDDRYLASGAQDGIVKIWDIEAEACIRTEKIFSNPK